jgi:hypothetical protein
VVSSGDGDEFAAGASHDSLQSRANSSSSGLSAAWKSPTTARCLNSPSVHTRLVSHLRARGHLVVADTVQVHPLNSVSARHDRSVLERDLHEWRTGNRDITVELH